jgi:glutamine amidotransferase
LAVATAEYGLAYTCALRKGNIQGVQFHPEKSLRHGMGLLKAFAEM